MTKIWKWKTNNRGWITVKRTKLAHLTYFFKKNSLIKWIYSSIAHTVLKMGFHSYVLLLPSNKVKNYDLLISVDLSTAG